MLTREGSRSKLDNFHKNAPIVPKLPSTHLPMIQLSVCYSESSKVYLHRSENARFPTDTLLFLLSPDALSSALRHMIDRRFEFQVNGRSTATWCTCHRDNLPSTGDMHGILQNQRWGDPCVDLTRNGRKQSDSKHRNRTTSSELFTSFKVQGRFEPFPFEGKKNRHRSGNLNLNIQRSVLKSSCQITNYIVFH